VSESICQHWFDTLLAVQHAGF